MYLSAVSSKLLLYDTKSWDLKKSYSCYNGILRDISWSDDGKYMLQVNSKGLIEVLSAAEHDVRSLQHIPLKDTWSASFHRDGHRNVAIGTKSGNVMIWDTKNKNIIKTFPTPTQQSSVNLLYFNSKNTSLAATMQNGDTTIYSLVSNIPVLTIKLSCSKSITAMKFHPESRSLLGLATDEGHIVLRDINTNKDKVFFENVHASPVSDFVYSLSNRDVMLSSGFDKMMHVYDVRLQNVVSTIRTAHTLTSMSINSNNQIAVGTKNGVVLVYDLRDYTNTLAVLKGHDHEVRKVSFQPFRKKLLSTDISLKEDVDMPSYEVRSSSPLLDHSTDLLCNVDTPPPKVFVEVTNHSKNDDDSFLAMVGLEQSNRLENDQNKSMQQYEVRSNQFEVRCNQLDVEKRINRISTPITSTVDNTSAPSTPLFANGLPEDCINSSFGTPPRKQLCNYQEATSSVDNKVAEELKDFIKLSLADVADDNRNYFLHIMMTLTKQKLFLEKQLSKVTEQMETIMFSQKALIETNRKLVMEIDSLKAERSYI